MPHHRSGGGKLSHGTAGSLQQRETRAPDGGAIVDYPKGWRFLPVSHNSPAGEILKKNPKVIQAMDRLHNLSAVPQTKQYGRDPHAPFFHKQETDLQMEIIAKAHYDLVIAPQIKAEEEKKAKLEEDQKLAIATLKMRVQELESTPEPIESSISYFPLALIPVVIIGAVLLLRRRG